MKVNKETLLLGLNNTWLWFENVLWSFFKKNWKAILIVILLIIALFSIKACNDSRKQLSDNERAAKWQDSVSNSKVKEWKDKYDKLHVEVDNIYVDMFSMQHYVDSIAKLLKLKSSKQIDEASKTGFVINVSGKPRIDTFFKSIPCGDNGKDSTYVASSYDFNWNDNWIRVKGSIGDGKEYFEVTGTDTLSRVDYWKRKWFLGAKTYYSDFQNANPHIKVVSYKGVQFKVKEPKWSIGLSIQAGYPVNYPIQLNKPAISAGISLQYSLIKF